MLWFVQSSLRSRPFAAPTLLPITLFPFPSLPITSSPLYPLSFRSFSLQFLLPPQSSPSRLSCFSKDPPRDSPLFNLANLSCLHSFHPLPGFPFLPSNLLQRSSLLSPQASMLPSTLPSNPLIPLSCIPLYRQLSSRFTFCYPASKAPNAVVLSLFATFSLSKPLYPLTLLLLTFSFLPSPFLQTPPPPLSPAAMVSSASCSSTFLTSSPLLFNPPLHTLPFNKYTPSSLPPPHPLPPKLLSHKR